MRAHSLAAHLVDFSTPRKTSDAIAIKPSRDVEAELVAARDAAFLAGHAEGLATAEAAWALQLSDAETQAKHDLASAREKWADSVADLVANRLADTMREANATVAGHVARILADIATRVRTPAAIDALVAQLMDLIRDQPAARLHVSGPQDLLAALDERQLDVPIASRTVNEAADLSVRIDDTLLETQLGNWHRALRDVFEAG